MPPVKHAVLSASSSHRWLNCNPSARLEEKFEDNETEAAAEGTAAGGGTVVLRVRRLPLRGGIAAFPDYLRVGADKDNVPPALKALPVRGVDKAVVLPLV